MGAYFEALDEGVLLVPLDPRYTQVGFNLISVQVCFLFEIIGKTFSFLMTTCNLEKISGMSVVHPANNTQNQNLTKS